MVRAETRSFYTPVSEAGSFEIAEAQTAGTEVYKKWFCHYNAINKRRNVSLAAKTDII